MPPLKVLIAEDSDSDRLILARLIQKLGHQVLEAVDGAEAVELFGLHQPDLVLLDALMPRMDGMEAARQIKWLAADRLVPVVFLTSLSETADLAQCLEAGGDDFLIKPYNSAILEAKIRAFNRMRVLHLELAEQHAQIQRQNERLLEEQRLALRVFENVAHTGCLDAANIRHYASPLSVFNGDVLFASQRPGGGLLVFLGDFTGHGLPAAIGAMPVAEIFYGMAARGFDGPDILREINRKLQRILPVGMFCCGAMIESDFKHGLLRVWNGGLPDGWLVRADGERVAIPSRHLPLGVQDPQRFSASMVVLNTSPGDWLVLMTDGFSESRNQLGECLGEEVVREVLADLGAGQSPFEPLMERISEHTGEPLPADDLTLCCLQIVDDNTEEAQAGRLSESALSGATDWRCVYELREQTLAEFSPLPMLLHICMEVPGLRRKSGEIYTLLSELYNNALEHGVLALSSEWKVSAGGFSRYYQERERRLADTDGHFIRFELSHRPRLGGGCLTIRCEDSGEGFVFAEASDTVSASQPVSGTTYSGRGLEILRRMSSHLQVHGAGNCVEIVYEWMLPGETGHGGNGPMMMENSR
ncbi:fused response regulator/phosphatase [Marinobacter fuscus]|uniref:Fused response regulator/phosphatase n=1 Tax=Marinobacter fuscus TaxID=2109942 RepID=A0A2T1K7Y8_9GAMM|nr:SpoIIE family protein phosphatase [Marinobacter fuscus]PSF06185.1 fused response regulator/phosphatase [Marinobacter fuscus]